MTVKEMFIVPKKWLYNAYEIYNKRFVFFIKQLAHFPSHINY